MPERPEPQKTQPQLPKQPQRRHIACTHAVEPTLPLDQRLLERLSPVAERRRAARYSAETELELLAVPQAVPQAVPTKSAEHHSNQCKVEVRSGLPRQLPTGQKRLSPVRFQMQDIAP